MNAQQVFKNTFNVLINECYSIRVDIDRCQSVSEHALSKEDFSRSTGIYMYSSNLNLNLGKTEGYNNEIFISNLGMKIDSNKNVNQGEAKS